VVPPSGNFWRFSKATLESAVAEGRAYFGKDGNRLPIIKRYLSDVQQGVVPRTWWTAEEAGTNQSAKRDHLRKLLPEIEPFGTPKPEELLSLILHIATNPGDLVLDSFLGSGTTAAVAHKMGRRWIGIEMGEHATTHCLPRLQKVIEGEPGGISQAVGWQGGGGFRFLRLGAPIFDADGCIHPEVRFATLAAFVWQQETGTAFNPTQGQPGTPWLGTHSVFDSCSRLPDGALEPISPENSAEPAPAPEPVLRSRTAYYLLFNGILGDKRPASGNVLTSAVLDALLALHATTPHPDAPLVVYGEACRLGEARLALARVTFKHIPYDVKAR
jgi:adenine-specific DNA-methyltransferase